MEAPPKSHGERDILAWEVASDKAIKGTCVHRYEPGQP